ncbi:MAG: hypothetical protein O3A95_07475 [Planctomycetota bacterium]|nr:hypothetical protein [Planctomycetota bacterium]MDA1114124.1 hypothetical protein [Planctomycetota bacterium]
MLPACGRSEAVDPTLGAAASIQLQGRRAWTGGQEGGPFLLVEEMSLPAHSNATIGGEEDLFRFTFSIPEDTRLLRVQVMEPGGQRALGQVVVDGALFSALGDPPEEVDARARLYWNGVTAGVQEYLPSDSQSTRLTYLVAAPATPPVASDASLQWQRGALTIELSAQSWSEPQRRAYLDAPAEFKDE